MSFKISARPSFTVPRVQHFKAVDSDGFTAIMVCRFEHIDCPEYGQPFHTEATEYLQSELEYNECSVQIVSVDAYGRLIVNVTRTADKLDIAEGLMREGLAWATSPKYKALQNQAREKRIGLWKDRDPIAPWDFRKTNKRQERTVW